MFRWRLSQTLYGRLLAALSLIVLFLVGSSGPGGARLGLSPGVARAAGCTLGVGGSSVQHVIYVQFDNVHFTRDLPNVPSDLEQMPHLLSFIKNNGTLISHNHTPLISHTSEDILTSLTGVYPNRHGVAVGQNSYDFYNSTGGTGFSTAFTYWTDTIGNGTYNMLSGAPTTTKPTGTNAPAPWVPFTRAGCDVGGVATANQELENANVNSKNGANDIGNVYGVNSPEAQEPTAQRTADFVGIAIHCSQQDSGASGMCSTGNHARPDILPDEPGGYTGFNALYGHKYVAPIISPSGPVTDLNGNVIKDASGNVGFPGFDGMSAAVSLGYVAAMQEHGVPVTYAYISDAHDLAGAKTHTALGPGEQAYEQQLKSYDDAFAKFFSRLQSDGITPANTLFVFTADENDRFTGGPPLDPSCTGATIDNTQNPPVVTPGNYCTYNKTPSTTPPGPPFGEVAVGLDGLLAQEQGLTNYTFSVGNDTAPAVYLNGQPAASDPSVRTFERATGALTMTNPLTNRVEGVAQYLADPVEMNILHTVTADPSRTPTFLLFGRPDLYITATCSGGFNSVPPPKVTPSCVLEQPAFAYLHGNIQPDITTTWLGMVGPGIKNIGIDNTTWSDHTDIRPTMLALLGLKDDYLHDGRVLYEDLTSAAIPANVQAQLPLVLNLGQTYKQLNAPLGQFALATLQLSTAALESGSSTTDTQYTTTEALLTRLGAQRDALATQMIALLEDVEFNGATVTTGQAQPLIAQASALIQQTAAMASGVGVEVDFRSLAPGNGEVLFGPTCSSLVMTATQDYGAGTTEHQVWVNGNQLPGTVGNIGLTPGATYAYEVVTITANGPEVDNNGGNCYTITIPGS
jgi:hypothetical protein